MFGVECIVKNSAEQIEKRDVKCESNNSRGGETYLALRAVSLYMCCICTRVNIVTKDSIHI